MRKEKARNHFLGKDGHAKLNCAQAVIKAFHDEFDSPKQDVDAFLAFGGGRAPEGRCGALYAADYLLSEKHSGHIERLEQSFLDAAGSLKCKEIRGKRQLSCLGCVETAADALQRALEKA